MARVVPLNQALKYVVGICLSIAVLGVCERMSYHLLAGPSVTAKWLGVAMAVAAPVAWLMLVAIGIPNFDEFERHVALVGTAVAFAATLVLRTGFYAIQDARFISPFATFPDLIATLAIWCLSVAAAALYYRARP